MEEPHQKLISLLKVIKEQQYPFHAGLEEVLRFQTFKMKYSFYFSILSILIFSSCNTEPTVVVSQNKKTPVSIAHNFTMTYTDSTLTKSFVSGKTHYDFTNDQLNFSEFFEDVELIIYDENPLSAEIMTLFEAFNQVGVSVLVATHDVSLIARSRHRLMTLVAGQLMQAEIA